MGKSFPFRQFIFKDRPFFLYDGVKLASNIQKVKNTMESILGISVSLSFSMKTQPNFKVVEEIKRLGLSLDVSSLNELNYALSLGYPPEQLFLGGVGITDQCIDLALGINVGGIHLNGIDLFESTVAKKSVSESSAQLSIRFHPSYLKGNKIGETKETLIKKFARKKSLGGLHVYVGRESFDSATVQKLFSDIEDLHNAEVFSSNWTLYFGPGLPDLDQLSIDSFKIRHSLKKIKVEVGRSIVSSCGYYGAQILSVKQFIPDRKTVIVDGGLQHFGSPWLSIHQGPRQAPGIFYDKNGKMKTRKKVAMAVYGSLCLWHDCLHPSFSVPVDIKRGDWLVVPNMGAYGLTAGVPLFIGETLPLEFYFDGQHYIDVTHNNFGTTAEE